MISKIENYVNIQKAKRKTLRRMMHSGFKDFEDVIHYFSAIESGKIDILNTRDLKDFKNSNIPILSPETTVKILTRLG